MRTNIFQSKATRKTIHSLKLLGMVAAVFMSRNSTSTAEPFRKVLTSTSQNLHVESWEITSRKVAPKGPAAWSVRKFTLHGGKQEGVDLIVVNNGKLEFTVVPTRGMGMLKAQMGDLRCR